MKPPIQRIKIIVNRSSNANGVFQQIRQN